MAPAKKSSASKAPKKAAAKSAPTHPSWTDMIKVLILSVFALYAPRLVLGHLWFLPSSPSSSSMRSS